MMLSARNAILDRIRTALGPSSADPRIAHAQIARDYQRTSSLSSDQALHLFIDRLIDYDTEIIHARNADEIAPAIAQALAVANETAVVAPLAFPRAWLPAHHDIVLDDHLDQAIIEKAQAVITTCEVAVASTGTIFLVHTGAQGRRILTLLPDHHICVVRHDQIVELLPEALSRIEPHARSPITTISGPSATSDIEMTRIRGVHGPRRLTVVLVAKT